MKSLDIQSLAVISSEIIFVEENYFSQSDQQIAKALGCRLGHVFFLKKLLGLIKVQVKKEHVQVEREEYVLANWQTQSDEEMAKHLSCHSYLVAVLRLRHGLKRPKVNSKNPQLSLLLKEDLERMVFREGKTFVQIGKDYNVSKEWIRQIAKSYGIRIRQPQEWHSNKQVLQQGIEKAGSIKNFIKEHGVSETKVYYWIKKFKLHCRSFRRKPEIANLNCTFCRKEFTRPKRLLRNKQQKVFFCNKICQGKWLSKYRWQKKP